MQRVASALLHAAGQDDLITNDLDQYEAIALELSSDSGRLRALRQRIGEAKSTAPFFSQKNWLRQFETGIMRAWKQNCAGLAPQAIVVDE